MIHRRLRRKLSCWLSKRLGSGRRFQHGRCDTLDHALEHADVIITCNNDFKTLERGLYTGMKIHILRNVIDEPNIIIAVGDARYVLDRRIARNIGVREAVQC